MGRVAGESGCFTKLTRDVFLIACEMMREKSWTALLAPLAVLVPAITLLNYYDERAFRRRWAPQFLINPRSRKRRPLAHRAAACGGGVGMTVTKAVWNQIQSNDHRLMRRVHRWRAPRWFRILMIGATRGGDGWLWYALGHHSAALWRGAPLCGDWRGRFRGGREHFSVPHAQAGQPPQAALRNRAALLGVDSAAG